MQFNVIHLHGLERADGIDVRDGPMEEVDEEGLPGGPGVREEG